MVRVPSVATVLDASARVLLVRRTGSGERQVVK